MTHFSCEIDCSNGENTFACKTPCKCQNGGICDESNGECTCKPGWTGEVCGNRCVTGTYGLNCSNVCDCFHDASCNHVTGEPDFNFMTMTLTVGF